jgi:hypothetical protein
MDEQHERNERGEGREGCEGSFPVCDEVATGTYLANESMCMCMC